MKKFYVEREEFINKTFRIPVVLADRMHKVCNNKNISLNRLTVKCIEYALNNSDMDT